MSLSIESNRALAVLFTVLMLSLSLNVYLGWRLRAVSTTPEQERRQIGVPVGTDLSSLPVHDLEGRMARINFNTGIPAVIYVLSPACRWCRSNEQNMHALAASKTGVFNFIGLSPTAQNLEQYISAGHAPFTVYVADPASLPPGLDIQTTPQTLIVSPAGIVEKAWLGAYDGSRKREIEAFFNVDLPGIKQQ